MTTTKNNGVPTNRSTNVSRFVFLSQLQARVFFFLLVVLSTSTTAYHTGVSGALKRAYPEWEPATIVDIGANSGEWSQKVRNHYPQAKLLLLEATPKHEPKLQQVVRELGQADYQIAVLTDQTGATVDFFQSGNTGNSMFQETTHHYANAVPTKRTTITLDDAMEQSPLFQKEPYLDYIKLDVQGAELVVLQGAEKSLEKATFVQFEASTTEYNAGGACFYEMDEFLRNHGFYMYDIGDQTRNPAFHTLGLGQFDVLYVKPTSPRLPDKFRELGGQYCGMGRSSSSSSDNNNNNNNNNALSTASLWSMNGFQELEQSLKQSLEQGIKPMTSSLTWTGFWSGWWVGMACGVVLCFAFAMGMKMGERRASRLPTTVMRSKKMATRRSRFS